MSRRERRWRRHWRRRHGIEVDSSGVPLRKRHEQYAELEFWNDYFTPVEGELTEMLEKLATEYGSWEQVSVAARMSRRHLTRLRHEFKAVSYATVERMLYNMGKEELLRTLPWYRPVELVDLGIWRPQMDIGTRQYAERFIISKQQKRR